MNKKSEILSDLKKSLSNQFGNDLKYVILFGSQAWNNASETSDYDFLIVLNDIYDWKTERTISNICYSIDLKYDIFTDIHIVSDYELKNTIKGYEPVFVKALKNGIYA